MSAFLTDQILQDGHRQARLVLTHWSWNGRYQAGMEDPPSQTTLLKSKNCQ